MEIFKGTPKFDFISQRSLYFVFSGALMAVSIGLLATRGINWGIDFTGGSVVQISFQSDVELPKLRSALSDAGFPDAIPQRFTGTNSYQIRIKSSGEASAETSETFLEKLKQAMAADPFEVDSKEFVGPTVGRHLYKQAVFAVFFSLCGIVIYVALRFSNPLWGFAGIVALAHDVTAVLGLFSALQMEFDLVLVAAVLTVAGYSINDSIVIFDRLREKMRIMRRETFAIMANASINDTLSRTLITSLTTVTTALVLFLVGGTIIHDFAMALTFGVLIGTYSSIAIAVPVVFQVETNRQKARSKGGKGEAAAKPAQPVGKRARRRR